MKKKIFSIIILILWAGVIFYLSNQSSVVSGNNSEYMVRKFVTSNNQILRTIHEPLRESMHFLEYFIFGMILCEVLHQFKLDKIVLIAMMISFSYSVSDEVHQVFIPGRAFQYFDITLDLIGAIIGVYLVKTLYKPRKV